VSPTWVVALTVALFFFVFVILFTLAVRYGTAYVGRILGARINTLHRDAEFILDTEMIPTTWLEPPPANSARRPAWERRQKQRALKKLKQLHAYMRNTPSISDIESREYILAEFGRIRKKWVETDLDQISALPTNQT
jgi:hypothetical protein